MSIDGIRRSGGLFRQIGIGRGSLDRTMNGMQVRLALSSQDQAPNRTGPSGLECAGAGGQGAAGGGNVVHQYYRPPVDRTITPEAVPYVITALLPGSAYLGRVVPGTG